MNLEPFRIVQELIAGSLFFMNIYLVYVFMVRAGTYKNLSWKSWRASPPAQGATMLALYFLGAMGLRGWEWMLVLLTILNIQFDYPKAEFMLWLVRNSWPMMLVAGLFALGGGIGIASVFAPPRRVRSVLYTVGLLAIVLPMIIFLIFHGWP